MGFGYTCHVTRMNESHTDINVRIKIIEMDNKRRRDRVSLAFRHLSHVSRITRMSESHTNVAFERITMIKMGQ